MTAPLLISALVGAGVSLLVAIVFNSLRGMKSDRKTTTNYPTQDEQVWE